MPGMTEAFSKLTDPVIWQSLHDRFDDLGVAFDWHEHGACPVLSEPGTGRPGGVVICLNLEGHGVWRDDRASLLLLPRHGCFYLPGTTGRHWMRRPHEHHRFVLATLSADFLRRHLSHLEDRLHPLLVALLHAAERSAGVGQPAPLSGRLLELAATLRAPPVSLAAQDLWYPAKAMELCAEFLFVAAPEDNLFCHRRKRVAQERVDRVTALLRAHMETPLPLEEIARRVGCSAHHLSRTFSSVTGCTIPQYLRQLRMERAAELLKSGRFNVTETALEVGYSSLSHFIQAFQEVYGCPPGAFGQGADT